MTASPSPTNETRLINGLINIVISERIVEVRLIKSALVMLVAGIALGLNDKDNAFINPPNAMADVETRDKDEIKV